MKKIYTLALFVCCIQLSLFAQSGMGTLRGKVIDERTKKPMDYVGITLKLNGITKATALTDDDGGYVIKTLQPGEYTLYATFVGYNNVKIEKVQIAAEEDRFVDFAMTNANGEVLKEVVIIYKDPLIHPGGVQGSNTDAKKLMAMPIRNVNAIAGLTAGVESRGNGTPNFGGSRADGTAYYIDGVRVNAGAINLPQNAIDNVQVITGGTPAQYGDFVGGAISTTTKAPTKNFNRGIEFITAAPFNGYLDNSMYNQIQGLVSGPIKTINKGRGDQEKVLLGFLVSGAITYAKNSSLPAVDIYKVKDDKLKQIENTPLVPGTGGTLRPAAEYLTASDLQKVGYKQNVPGYSFDLNGNFNFQPSKNINVRLGYFANFSDGRNYSSYNSLMNYATNSETRSNTVRTYLQFTQKFSKEQDKDAKDNPEKVGGISNAYYSVRVSYERAFAEAFDPNFGRDLFNYGYLGTFKTYSTPTFGRVVKNFGDSADKFLLPDGRVMYLTNYIKQTGYQDTAYTFDQDPNLNRVRGNYTRALYDYLGANNVNNLGTVRQLGGLINGDNPTGIYSLMWGNVGALQSSYSKSLNESYTLYAMSEFTVAPKSNPKAKHELQFGFTAEQQFSRSYGVNANGLWELMRLQANRQFSGMNDTILPDTTVNGVHYSNLHIAGITKFDNNGVFQDTVWFNRKIISADQSNFDQNLRAKLISMGATDVNGKLINQNSFIDVNSYKPSMYSLNMFNASELLNNGSSYVSYQGYDYLGNKVKGKPGVADFLNDPSKRYLPAYQPVYMAAWMQDKFVFKDLIVRIGVRVERFDANQVVLKDPYSLVPIYTVGDVKRSSNSNIAALASQVPGNIGDGATIYVNDDNQNGKKLTVTGFRNGNNWYDKNGNPITDPQQIARDGNTNRNIPLFLDNNNKNLPTVASFRDYRPDVRVLPRLWFSFPISTTSQFFGTYDVLTQRPNNNVAQMDDYFYFQNRLSGGAIQNPDLKMSQKTEYVIGFKQQVGQDAALGITATYREFRDLIQLYRYVQSWPNDYTTYGNLDFATVKSIALEYTVRELGNLSIFSNYQLQFANGTGSNATSSTALVQAGLSTLRTIYPMDFDTRHTLKINLDYHYKEGKEYNGPIVNGKKIFENAGMNFIFTTYSGRPYSQYQSPTPADGVQGGVAIRSQLKGTINGANLPPQYNVDIVFDKNFIFKQKKIDGSVTAYRLRVYLQIQNLLNAANVASVYRYTGSAYNDGFLASPSSKEQKNSATNQQSYVDLYNARMVNPDRFYLPRLTRLGVALYF